ncbi:ABC transporter substrate-binding protein [Methylocapsa sp. S129]|uniref:ABC transporter substrate-binding protein n=1 Tax=Methylocapsa sp. S129 TaxID=1641869 RepID=UPI00131B65A3|nr:ABC transporter substrate-binding protein [Methylocapsa sp. S129]
MNRISQSAARPWARLFLSAVALAAFSVPARAQTKIAIGCTATSDCASAMVAVDQGIFTKHGLDAQMVRIGINSTIPAAILSDSIQIGGPTESVFLQAVDGGLDLVAVEGASRMDPIANEAVAAFARNGTTLKEAKDFVGKKVGAPGIGAFLQVLFVKWLVEKGVDPKSVNFVEVTFPTMSDTLKSGAVDAVLTAEPFVTRMTKAGTGYVAAHYAAELARTEPIISYVAARAYAEKNPEAIANFRAAIAEAADIVNNDREKASVSIANFTKQPLEIVRLNRPNLAAPELKSDQLAWWLDVMKQQNLLQSQIDPSKLVFP